MNGAAAPELRPTRARHGVVAFAVVLAIITYVDRVCISQAAPSIRAEFALTPTQMGWVLSAFAWTYGIFEIPWGWLGDRLGPRRILTRVAVLWSLFTAATGAAWNLTSLIVARACFGAGEAGCFPNLTRAFGAWLPATERVRAQGILWLSARWGGAFTPLLVVFALQFMSWRGTFLFFGILGVVWAVFFFRWYRDDPREHPGLNAAERALLPEAASLRPGGAVPWRRFLTSPSAWALWIQYFFLGYAFFFYMSWLPTYLIEVHKVENATQALLAGIPLFAAGIGSLFCGFFLARLERWTGGPRAARRLMALVGFGGAALMTLLSLHVRDAAGAMLVLGLAGFANDLAMPPSWGACMDMGGRFSGTLSGAMNTMSCLGAAAFPVVTGLILERWTDHDWSVVFIVSAAAYAAGMFCWLLIDPVTPLEASP